MRDEALYTPGWDDPARRAFAITPDDDQDLAYLPRAIYVGKTGDITVCFIDDENDTSPILLAGVKVGTLLPIRVRRVMATGTTSTDLVGLF